MTTKKKTVVQEEVEERKPFSETVHKVLLASIGAVALAQEEIEEFVNKLIERGEIAEQEGKKMVTEVVERRKKGAERAQDEMNKQVEDILDRMNVPTKNDIEALSAKISELSKKVDELKKA